MLSSSRSLHILNVWILIIRHLSHVNARLRKQSSIHKSTNQTQVIWQQVESSNVLEEIGNNGLPSEVFPLSHCKGGKQYKILYVSLSSFYYSLTSYVNIIIYLS